MSEQIKSKLETTRSPLAARPRHENWSVMTRSSREPTRYASHLNCLHPLPLLPPSPSSTGQRRRATLLPIRARNLGVENSWEEMSKLLSRSTLFRWRSLTTSYSKSQSPPNSQFISWILQHVESARSTSSHNLVHHEVKIWIINPSVVHARSDFQKSSGYQKASWALPFRMQVTPRLPKPKDELFISTPSPWSSEKRKLRGHL